MDLRCILHVGNAESAEETKPLDLSKWQKLQSVVKTRKTLVKKTKYDSILADFPENLEVSHGYHSKCYKNFTAIPKITTYASSTAVRTRSGEPAEPTSSTGVLPPICIFCRHVYSPTMEELGASETGNAEIRIRKIAFKINDIKLLSFIGHYLYNNGRDFVALEAKYHHSCRRKYLNKGRDPKNKG